VKRAVLVVIAWSAIAVAQPSDKPQTAAAQARLTAGTKAFKANDFAAASKEFAAGYAAEPWSGFLFAWAQSERRRGDCPSAVKLYTRFNATNPPPEVRQLSDDAIAVCGAAPATAVVEPPVVEPKLEPKPDPPNPDPPKSDPPERQPEIERPFQHKLALGLGAAAAVAGGVAIGFYVSSNGIADDANRAGSHPEAVTLYERAQDRRLVAQISGGVGIALATAAVLRFVLHRPADDDRQLTGDRTISVGPSSVTFIARW